MFSYKILNTEEIISTVPAIMEDDIEISPAAVYRTIKMLVEYTFENDIIKNISISVFEPEDQLSIERSINNRGILEESKLNN